MCQARDRAQPTNERVFLECSVSVLKGQAMRVRIDREKCVSAGNCVVTAPTAFLMDAENKARINDPGSVEGDVLFLAAEMCPTEAIVIENDDGEQLYP